MNEKRNEMKLKMRINENEKSKYTQNLKNQEKSQI